MNSSPLSDVEKITTSGKAKA